MYLFSSATVLKMSVNGEDAENRLPQTNGSEEHVNGVAEGKGHKRAEEKEVVVDSNTNATVTDQSSEHSKEDPASDEKLVLSDTDVRA